MSEVGAENAGRWMRYLDSQLSIGKGQAGTDKTRVLEQERRRTYTPALRKFTALVEDFSASIGRHPWTHGSTHQLQELVGTRGVVEALIAYAHEEGLQAVTIEGYIAA